MTIGGWPVGAVLAEQSTDETVAVDFDHLALFVRGGPADNHLTVSLDDNAGQYAGQYVIDSNLPVSPSNNCEATTVTEARCDHFVDGESIHMEGRRGDDRLTVLTAAYPAAAFGGPGEDRIKATAGRNVLFGDDGHDRISSGAGNDRIGGGRGRDRSLAGAGNDRLIEDDRQRDRLIDCGAGDDDVARVDAGLDPEPVGCERVHVE